jgi:DNA-directed RNA polymerase subunit M/transcription elongation factor TFIIS
MTPGNALPRKRRKPAMAKIKESHVRCNKCGTRFRSPIFFATTEVFDSAMTSGNVFVCPKCKNEIPCNKDNMSYVLEGGKEGSVGNKYGQNE